MRRVVWLRLVDLWRGIFTFHVKHLHAEHEVEFVVGSVFVVGEAVFDGGEECVGGLRGWWEVEVTFFDEFALEGGGCGFSGFDVAAREVGVVVLDVAAEKDAVSVLGRWVVDQGAGDELDVGWSGRVWHGRVRMLRFAGSGSGLMVKGGWGEVERVGS